MTPEEITDILKSRFGDKIVGANFQTVHPNIQVAAEAWHDAALFLRNDPRLRFDFLRCISAVDMLDAKELVAVYDLISTDGTTGSRDLWKKRHDVCIKVKVPRDNPHLASVADVWPTADWHEREAYDLMGIVFDGHPDSVEDSDGRHPRRILCPEDWAGYPLRKDYVFPMEYHGIPAVTEYEQTRPIH